MTKRKRTDEDPYTRLELAQYRLRKMALDLDNGVLSSDDRDFLVGALWGIGKGDDANVILGVKARRGERKTSEEASKRDRARMAIGWIAAAIRPKEDGEDGGLGMSLDDAFASAGKKRRGKFIFGLSEDSLRTTWTSHPEWHSPSFPRPISSFPDRNQGKKSG
jgi:hypothetical protein